MLALKKIEGGREREREREREGKMEKVEVKEDV